MQVLKLLPQSRALQHNHNFSLSGGQLIQKCGTCIGFMVVELIPNHIPIFSSWDIWRSDSFPFQSLKANCSFHFPPRVKFSEMVTCGLSGADPSIATW